MNILHSCLEWMPITQRWLYEIISESSKFTNTYVVCEKKNDNYPFDNLNVLEEKTGFSQFLIFKKVLEHTVNRSLINPYLKNIIQTNNIDLYHSHFGTRGWFDMKTVAACKIPHVVNFYGSDITMLPQKESIWQDRYAELFENATRFICEGEHMAELLRYNGCPADKIFINKIGVKVDEIEFKPLYWKPGEPLKMLIAGTFTEKKGFPYALEALGQLLRCRENLDLEITAIGEARSNEAGKAEYKRMLSEIEHYRLSDNITFLGYCSREELLENYYKHHCILSPSVTALNGDKEGGAPVTLLEAAAAGLMVISSYHCDIPFIFKHKESGMLSSERNSKAITQNLVWLLDNYDQWGRIKNKARNKIDNEYRITGTSLIYIVNCLTKCTLNENCTDKYVISSIKRRRGGAFCSDSG